MRESKLITVHITLFLALRCYSCHRDSINMGAEVGSEAPLSLKIVQRGKIYEYWVIFMEVIAASGTGVIYFIYCSWSVYTLANAYWTAEHNMLVAEKISRSMRSEEKREERCFPVLTSTENVFACSMTCSKTLSSILSWGFQWMHHLEVLKGTCCPSLKAYLGDLYPNPPSSSKWLCCYIV